jgi:hypothetical protein
LGDNVGGIITVGCGGVLVESLSILWAAETIVDRTTVWFTRRLAVE